MRYETPELMTLPPAINAIQTIKQLPINHNDPAYPETEVSVGTYEDWE